jgi:hypothetical protein
MAWGAASDFPKLDRLILPPERCKVWRSRFSEGHKMKNSKKFQAAGLAFGLALAAFGASTAQASSQGKPISCNVQPGQKWLGEEKIRAIFGASEYLDVKFKTSKMQCYEFYAIKKNGDVVEAYYHPVTGDLVQRNLIPRAAARP